MYWSYQCNNIQWLLFHQQLPKRLCPIFLFLREYCHLFLWMFLMFLWTFSFSPLGRSGVINHPYKCTDFSCVPSLPKKTPGLSFSLRSNIKAHIRLQSHLNFWTAGFIILLFRKRAWFYRIDSNSLACPDVLWEPWCAQTDEESSEFMRT